MAPGTKHVDSLAPSRHGFGLPDRLNARHHASDTTTIQGTNIRWESTGLRPHACDRQPNCDPPPAARGGSADGAGRPSNAPLVARRLREWRGGERALRGVFLHVLELRRAP